MNRDQRRPNMCLRYLARIIFVSFIVLTATLYAQTQTGSMQGTVSDPEGNALPGVTITIQGPALMGIGNFISTAAGTFRFPALPPGVYSLTAQLTGFKTVKRGELVVNVGVTLDFRLVLEPSTLSEEVTAL